MKIIELIKNISEESIKLKNKYVSEDGLEIDWVCIFSKNVTDYKKLLIEAKKIGEPIEDTKSGIIFKFIKKIKTGSGIPKIFKVRKYDPTKLEMGDVDFTTKYVKFKKKYLVEDHFKLIKRERFEMIELMDSDYNVRVYFSSIPPSVLRGIVN